MKIEMTLTEWQEFCEWIQQNPYRRNHYTATLIPTRHASTYVDEASQYPVYSVDLRDSLAVEWFLGPGAVTAAKRSAKNF